MTALLVQLALLAALAAPPVSPTPTDGAVPLPNGLSLPYPTVEVFRGFEDCRADRVSHEHEGVDLGGVGPDGGLGTAVRALTRARVTRIALGRDLPGLAGYPDTRPGTARRNSRDFPRTRVIDGYGEVVFFTRHKGWWRTGNMLVTEGIGGPLDKHRVRYLHLAAVRPDLKVGDVVAAGEEIGLMGGTGVQEDWPHLHLDVRDPDAQVVDPAPLIGLGRSARCGPSRKRGYHDARAFRTAARAIDGDWRPRVWAPPVGAPALRGVGDRVGPVDVVRTPQALIAAGLVDGGSRVWRKRFGTGACGTWKHDEDFSTGAYDAHAFEIRLWEGQVIEATLAPTAGAVQPRLALVHALTGEAFAPDRLSVLASPTTEAPTSPTRMRLAVDEETPVFVTVVAPPGEARRDVRYDLMVRSRCRRARPAPAQAPAHGPRAPQPPPP